MRTARRADGTAVCSHCDAWRRRWYSLRCRRFGLVHCTCT